MNVMAAQSQGTKCLRENFCSRFRCSDEEFERVALLKLLHRRSLPLARILLLTNPSFFATDFAIIRQLGLIDSRAQLAVEARDLWKDYLRCGDFGLMRRVLKVRISGKQLLRVGEEVWQ